MNKYISLFGLITFLSCEESYVPKPRGYHRIDLPDHTYTKLVENEGFYRPMQDLISGKKVKNRKNPASYINEELIQKTLKMSLEHSLYKRGIRDCDILREVQIYDDKRFDILVKYGFIGPIMIEIKLLHNPEIVSPEKRLNYKNKLKQYLNATSSKSGIYLIFDVKKIPDHTTIFDELIEEYKDIENLLIKKVVCYK